MSETNRRVRVAISVGDVNGVGCEVMMKTLCEQHVTECCTPVIFGSGKVLAYNRKVFNIQNFNVVQIRDTSEIADRKINVVNCMSDDIKVEFGKATEAAGQAARASLLAAAAAVRDGQADVLLTAPVNKSTMQDGSGPFTGHTEFLRTFFNAPEVLMLMVSDHLKIGTVTGHIPLKEVASVLTSDGILAKLRLLNQSLKQDFTVLRPRIAVLALNPHAGEQGVLGAEETQIIGPALAAAAEEGIQAFGPFPADGFFASEQMLHFDAVLAMYHDQAMLPFKLLNFRSGVNFTAGLPVVRTSPAHGTAYDIAGRNEASCTSFREALFAACDIHRRRVALAACMAGALKDTHTGKNARKEEEQ